MFEYIFILAFEILLFFFIYSNKNRIKDPNKIFLILTFIILCLFSGLRNYSVGTDSLFYMNIFQAINMRYEGLSLIQHNYEPLFVLFNKFTFYLSENPQTILISTSFIINILVLKRIYQSSKYVWLSVYLYLTMYIYCQTFNGIRQYIAIAIFFYISKYIEEKKLVRYIIGLLIAAGFHQSAIILLPVYFINRIKVNKKNTIILLLIMTVAYLNLEKIMENIFSFFIRYQYYYDLFYQNLGGLRDLSVSLSLVIFGLTIMSLYGSNKRSRELFKYIMIYFGISILLLKSSAILMARIGWYFSIFSIIYIPEILNLIKDKRTKLLLIIIIMSVSLFYYIYLLLNNFEGVIPYELSIW